MAINLSRKTVTCITINLLWAILILCEFHWPLEHYFDDQPSYGNRKIICLLTVATYLNKDLNNLSVGKTFLLLWMHNNTLGTNSSGLSSQFLTSFVKLWTFALKDSCCTMQKFIGLDNRKV